MKSFRRQGIAVAVTLLLLSAAGQVCADPVSDWNAIASVVLLNSGRPGGACIVDMAYVHIAIFDAVNAIDGRYTPFAVRPTSAAPWASVDAAVVAAAYTVLARFYPNQLDYLNSAYQHSLVDVPNNDTKARGLAIGVEVAERFLAMRADDGRNAVIPYVFGSGPGVYQLTPGAPAPPATPQTPWIAHLKPFAMLSDSMFRAPSPPALTSDLYARDFNEIKRYGVRDNSARTPQQTETGRFYLDNPNTQLSRNLRLVVASRTMSVADIARFFAQMYVTIGDAVISAWDSKFHYNCWRPVTAIRAADTDGNPNTEADTAWIPLATTPGHPEYPAAHGYVTGALAYGLERFFGTSALDVILTSASVPGSPMTYHTYASTDSIVREVINARVYGGMHFRNSVEVGAASARKVADWVADHFFKPAEEAPVPTANLQLWLRADSGLTLNGSTVSRWADLSGNGHDAVQATASRQPQLVDAALNGKPVLRFDGVNDKLGFTGSTVMTQFSLFVVLNNHVGTPGNDGNVITFGANGGYPHQWFLIMRYPNTPDSIAMGNATNSYVNAFSHNVAAYDQWRNLSIVTTGSLSSTTLRWDGNDAHMALDGFDQTISFPLGDATGSGGGIGGADGVPDGTILAKCDVAEILVYNIALTDSARKTVETYLATKYGLQQGSVPTAGLKLWLKADTGVDTLNGVVSRWHDQSGHGNDAIQADVSRQPQLVSRALNGKPALRFDGVNDRLGLTGTTRLHQISMFMVFKIDSGATSVPDNQVGVHPYYPIQLGDSYVEGQVYGLSMRNDFSGNSPNIIDPFTGYASWVHATLPGIASFGDWKVLSVTTDKVMFSTNLRVGGQEAVISPQTNTNMAISVPLGSANGLGVGGIGGGDHLAPSFGTSIFKGDVAEVIVYDTVLADADRRAVEHYLSSRYSIPMATGTAVQNETPLVPLRFALEQNYPNPFNPSTTIRYTVGGAGSQGPGASKTMLVVYDVLGRKVATLVNEVQAPGTYEVRFDGSGLASGVYFFRLQAGDLVQTRKMILTK